MKTKRILFLYILFICTALYAASPSYERMKTLIWKHTIHFIYEDNGMMDQYRENYGTHFFSNGTDFDSLKNDALEKTFFLSVENEMNTEGVARKIALERLVDAIVTKLNSHSKRQNDTVKLAKVDSLQHRLQRLIQEEYQEEEQLAQTAFNAEETNEPSATSSSNYWDWFVIALLMLLLISTGLAFWRIMKVARGIGEEIVTIRQHIQFNTNPSSDSDSPSAQHHLTTIQKEMGSIREQISQLHTLMERTPPSPKEIPHSENLLVSSFEDVAVDEKQGVRESSPALLYAKKPNDKLFKHETLSTTVRHDSIYRIQEGKDGMATFTINEDKKVQNYALQNGGEMFLNEACEIQYENNRPVRITTEAPGKLVKEGKHWRIQEKARVTLR